MKRTIEQLIFGSLLGDMYMGYGTRCCNPYIKVKHGMKQKEHVMMKYDVLKEYATAAPKPIKSGGFSKDGLSFGFRTKSATTYESYYNLCYPNGKKTVSMDWLCRLTEEGLAYWYMDDGGLVRSAIQIATYSFSYKEHLIIKQYFKHTWDITISIKKKCKGKYWCVHMNAANRNKFCKLIKPYLIDSMMYKYLYTQITKSCVICEKSYIANRNSSKTCSSICNKEYLRILSLRSYYKRKEKNANTTQNLRCHKI